MRAFRKLELGRRVTDERAINEDLDGLLADTPVGIMEQRFQRVVLPLPETRIQLRQRPLALLLQPVHADR